MSLHHPLAETLVRRFAEARLPLLITPGPLTGRGVRGAEDIFQMDIRRPSPKRRDVERFVLWPGRADNRVEVEGVERDLRQLVLMVHEPRRRFEVRVSANAVPPGARILRRERKAAWVEQWTNDSKRHFLCGLDEHHLFAAQLPRAVSAVRAAHDVLKPPAVASAERRLATTAVRQGEWFFLPVAPDKRRVLDEELRASDALIQRRVGIAQAAALSRRGRPHIADEVFVVRGPQPEVYVRGGVRHPDHATVFFHDWVRVWGNLENWQPVAGLQWVD